MNASTPPQDSLIGRVLQQRYRVVERLSEGAMGVVYRGERVALQRPVAIKFLHAAVAEQESLRRRFEVEARAMGRLSHPNCVSVIDFGVEEVPYVVMDLVDGRSLRDILNAGAVSTSRALNVGRQLLTALVHAHAQGIVHRDIKPENMMLQHSAGLEDHLRVLDFGMAKITNQSAGLTAGFVLGTPNYMAPEQAQESDIDARADLYSAAIVIFELLTGQQPFAADTMGEILRRQIQMPAPALRTVKPAENFSAALEAVLLRAMAKQPAERFASAAEMLDALEAVPECRGTQPAAAVLPAPAGGRKLPPPPFKAKTPPAPVNAEDATRLDLQAPSGARLSPAAAPKPETEAKAAPVGLASSHQLTMQLAEDDAEALDTPPTLLAGVKTGLAGVAARTRTIAVAVWAWLSDKSRRPYEVAAAALMLLFIGVLLMSRGGGEKPASASAPGQATPEKAAPTKNAQAAAVPAARAPAEKAEEARAERTAEAKPESGESRTARTTTRKNTSARSSDARWTQTRREPAATKPQPRPAEAPLRRASASERWGTHWGK